ncbi:MAG: cytochrome b N-terminal domain-containing protein [Chloroflexi bacterium]|nr:cytochrome b N-terminal domain-containing protein [Chloroflexota bacterium]
MTYKRPNFFYHLHPPTLPARESRFGYTFGLGGISLLLFLVLGVTGVLEMFIYLPTPTGAAESIRQITYLAPFGWLLRNMHYWGGQMMVGTVVLHMARVVLSGGYKGRRFNWLIGMALLVLTLLLDFTGYVLRWDQDTAWALVTGTNLIDAIPGIGPALYRLLVGGQAVGQATLLRFYAWHVLGLVLVATVLIAWHSFRVRRDGGISHREPASRVGREQLVRTELLAALLTLAVLVGLSVAANAPLGPAADLSVLAGEPRAPWFFLWIQELLRSAPPFLAGVLAPAAVLLLLSVLPYALDRGQAGSGEWFNRPGRLAQGVFLAVVILVIVLTARGLLR